MINSIIAAIQSLSFIEKALCIVMLVLVVGMVWVVVEESWRFISGKGPF